MVGLDAPRLLNVGNGMLSIAPYLSYEVALGTPFQDALAESEPLIPNVTRNVFLRRQYSRESFSRYAW